MQFGEMGSAQEKLAAHWGFSSAFQGPGGSLAAAGYGLRKATFSFPNSLFMLNLQEENHQISSPAPHRV